MIAATETPDSGFVNRNERFVYPFLAGLAAFAGRRLGSDGNFDLYNYHAYIGKAAISGRWKTDVAPAGLGSYNNPLADIPVAVLLNSSVRALTIGLAALQFLCWAATWFFINEVGRRRTLPDRLVALFVALSGSIALSVAFTTFQDWTVAACLLMSVTLILRAQRLPKARWALGAGFFGAVALAVKLTAAPLLVAIGVACLFGFRRRIGQLFGGFLAGFSLFVLPWWILVANRFGNPVFPFYNGVFKAPSGGSVSFDDSRFGAASWQDFGRLPIELLRGTTRYSELLFRDWRPLAIVVVGLVLSATRTVTIEERTQWKFLAIVSGTGGIIWLIQFGIYRYFLFLEIIGSVFIGLMIPHCLQRFGRSWLVIGLAVLGSFQIAPNWGRNTPLRVTVPGLAGENVILADLGPTSYLVNSLPKETRIASIQGFAFGFFGQEGPLWNDLQKFVKQSADQNGLMIVVNPEQPLNPIVAQLGIQPDVSTCQSFAGPYNNLSICRAVALADPL